MNVKIPKSLLYPLLIEISRPVELDAQDKAEAFMERLRDEFDDTLCDEGFEQISAHPSACAALIRALACALGAKHTETVVSPRNESDPDVYDIWVKYTLDGKHAFTDIMTVWY